MLCNIQSALAFLQNPSSSPNTKHIDISYHLVREKVAEKQLLPEHDPTGEIAAYALTKPLPVPAYTECHAAMGLSNYNLHRSTPAGVCCDGGERNCFVHPAPRPRHPLSPNVGGRRRRHRRG